MTLLLFASLTSKAIARSGGLHAKRQNDRGQSFFDNDRSSAAGPGNSSGGSSGGRWSSWRWPARSSRAGGTSGGGDGSGGSGGDGGGGKGRSRPAVALEIQARRAGSIAPTKRTKKSARPIAPGLILGFRAQSNPAGRSLLSPCMSAMGRRTASNARAFAPACWKVWPKAHLSNLWSASAEGSAP